jgi:hypothetical protein
MPIGQTARRSWVNMFISLVLPSRGREPYAPVNRDEHHPWCNP